MFSWDTTDTHGRFQLVLDIGSGSVGAALLDTKFATADHSACIWSKRVHLVFNDNSGADRMVHALKTALMNALLITNSEGRKELEQIDEKARLSGVHVYITAPWVHTAPRRITYSQEHPFTVNQTLLSDLADEADQSIVQTLTDDPLFTTGAIEVLSTTTSQLEINGYDVPDNQTAEAKTLAFTHHTSFISHPVKQAVVDLIVETFGEINTNLQAFMPHFAAAMIAMRTERSFCVFDITHESTEVGIVRDNILTTITQIPIGISTLAKEIAAIKKAPVETGYQLLRNANVADAKLTNKQRDQVTELIGSYEQALSKQLAELEDDLLPPALVCLHTDRDFADFFTQRITHSLHHLYPNDVSITTVPAADIVNQSMPAAGDSALSFATYLTLQSLNHNELLNESTNS